MLTSCEQAMRGACADFGAELAEFNGQDKNAHLPVTHPPKTAISAPANSPKEVSARRLRAQFTSQVNPYWIHGHFWSPPYLATSCGRPPLSTINQYIEQQDQSG
jgi:putative transposase